MILPLFVGYITGSFTSKRSQAIGFGLLIGALLGLAASYTFIPLLYPIFAGKIGEVGIPEFNSIGIMFLLPDIVVYSESVYFLTRSIVIDLCLMMTGAATAVLGVWFGSIHYVKRIATPFKEM
ncbi:MAG: hypothetical protein ACFFBL_11295 [Promethearchaeota archaeon]